MTLSEQLRAQSFADRVTTLRVLLGQLKEDVELVPHTKIVSGLLVAACASLQAAAREIEGRGWARSVSDRGVRRDERGAA